MMERSRCCLRCFHIFAVFLVLAAASAQQTGSGGNVPADARCRVSERLTCGYPGIGRTACEAIDCCFDGQQCYYGNAVTLQCTEDGHFLVVVAKSSAALHLTSPAVSQLGDGAPSCGPVAVTDSFDVYNFPVTACGTTQKVEGNYVVFESRLFLFCSAGMGLPNLAKNTLSQEVILQCKYLTLSTAEVPMVLQPIAIAAPGPLRIELRLAKGQCHASGCDEGVHLYSSYYGQSDGPITKMLRDPVYVEVRILERTDPNLVLLLERCWATLATDPLSLPQWRLLVDGCPDQTDKYQTTLVPVDGSSGLPFPSHYKRFAVKMFAFVDQNFHPHQMQKVFFHCSVAVCHLSAADNCEQRCFRKGRAIDADWKDRHREKATVSSQEVILTTHDAPGQRLQAIGFGW
uniref:Zona pellucida sperm-binding protein 4 n=1 Tax=Paramormyrops kingsleyae TaxID=1676925 RepID=A0A3B3QSB2_9TELE|nr:zona pellucida sperm-binding protein 4-like [Paramormyrops kingsleyae]